MQSRAEVASKKNIAVIGSGISGLFCAYLLSRHHHVSVFEAEKNIGGHTATKTVEVEGKNYDIDTGFIVFNDRTYPNFIKLLAELKIASQATDMGFSVSCHQRGFEYSGTSLNGLFAQRRNIFRLSYWRMLKEILRFNNACSHAYKTDSIPQDKTLGDYLLEKGYSHFFQTYYIFPMVSAIWSSGLQVAAAMPLVFFIRFFYNHGLLTVTQQPQWYTVKGGSKTYLTPLVENFKDSIYTQCPVQWVKRRADGVTLSTELHGRQDFDEVIFACHSDQALKLLLDPSADEKAVLSAIAYKANEVSLHTDENLLPKSKRAWASWNYLMLQNPSNKKGGTAPNLLPREDSAALTYNMNILQRIESATTFCVSVNAANAVNPDKLLGQYVYSHPVFTRASVAAQALWKDISGKQHTHFCGAYWRNGFHEDGVVSGLRVARSLGEEW